MKDLQLTAFLDLGLAEPITQALADEQYATPTPIQAQTIPQVLQAATSSASRRPEPARPPPSRCRSSITSPTTASEPLPKSCRVLVLSPTRELSAQIVDSFKTYGRYLRPTRGARHRRREHQPADARARPWRRRAGRDARAAARPDVAPRRAASTASRSSCSTKPTACSTWASSTTSAASSRSCRPSARRCSSRPPCRARSPSSPTPC